MGAIDRAEVEQLIADSERRLVDAVQRALEELTAGMNEQVNAALAARPPELVTGPSIRQVHRDADGNIAMLEEWAPYCG